MKKIFFVFITGSILILAITNEASAQKLRNINLSGALEDLAAIDNRPSVTDKSPSPGINTKALNNFRKSYIGASNVKWIKDEQLVAAEFMSDGCQTVVYYDSKGHWQSSIKSYKEEKFDRGLRSIVRREYYDYKIDMVQEIQTRDTYGVSTYLVFIEDDNNFKVVRLSNDFMDVYQQFKKQK